MHGFLITSICLCLSILIHYVIIIFLRLNSTPTGDCNSSLCKTISIINNNNKDTSLTSYIIELLNGAHDDHAVVSKKDKFNIILSINSFHTV